MSETVVELKPAAPALSLPREIPPEDWARYREQHGGDPRRARAPARDAGDA